MKLNLTEPMTESQAKADLERANADAVVNVQANCFVRDMQLTDIASGISRELERALHFHAGGNGAGTTQVTPEEARTCQKVAEHAVMQVDGYARTKAETAARAVLEEAIKDARALALRHDVDHSAVFLIAAALDRMEKALRRVDPTRLVLSTFHDALVVPGVQR